MRLLKDKQYKYYSRLSRYTGVPFYYDVSNNKYVFGVSKRLSQRTPYQVYTIEYGDTLDSLALKFYDNPTYYWVICSFNNISDPFIDLIPGNILYIPTLSSIEVERG